MPTQETKEARILWFVVLGLIPLLIAVIAICSLHCGREVDDQVPEAVVFARKYGRVLVKEFSAFLFRESPRSSVLLIKPWPDRALSKSEAAESRALQNVIPKDMKILSEVFAFTIHPDLSHRPRFCIIVFRSLLPACPATPSGMSKNSKNQRFRLIWALPPRIIS